jgi:hypothetical protein
MKATSLKKKQRNIYVVVFILLFIYGLLTSVTYVNNNGFSGLNFNILSIGVMIYSGYMLISVFLRGKPLMYGTHQNFVFHNSLLMKNLIIKDYIIDIVETPEKPHILHISTRTKMYVLNLNMYNITKEELIEKYELLKVEPSDLVYEAPKTEAKDDYDF